MAAMASCSVLFSSFFFLLLLSLPISNAHLSRTKLLLSPDLEQQQQPPPLPPFDPTTFFEVARPVDLPDAESCSALLLRHDFGYTYGLPPVVANYTPPSHCLRLQRPSRIVLRWSATSQGRQYDRLIGVWLGGVEVLRSCTAEPRPAGIFWSVEKDVTRYASLFARPQTLAVYLGNLVDSTYTGVYHVNISAHWYFDKDGGGRHRGSPIPGFSSPADLILPLSRSLPLDDGLWFRIQNSTDVQTKALAVPRNAYRAVLEVYVAPQAADEFWYTNPPNSYVEENDPDIPGNGAFREVTVQIDGKVVGAVWPFTVVYTGGINPLLWRPISAIGSFNFPTYDIEITPFLGKILDGEEHEFGFGVTDALNVWYVNANLHLWLDAKSSKTVGSLIKYEAPEFAPSLVSQFKGPDGSFKTNAARRISSTGWVKSSFGKITTHFFQKFEFENLMEFSGRGDIQVVNQTIDSSYGVYTKHPSSVLYSEQVFRKFPLHLHTASADRVNDSYTFISNVSLGFQEKRFSGEKSGFSYSSLKNSQAGQGYMRVKGHLVVRGLASTQQVYKYESTDGCYFRNVSSRNYTILHDETEESCTKNWPLLGENFLS